MRFTTGLPAGAMLWGRHRPMPTFNDQVRRLSERETAIRRHHYWPDGYEKLDGYDKDEDAPPVGDFDKFARTDVCDDPDKGLIRAADKAPGGT